jgi:2-oxoisovalerate dehydrogenase E1 component
MSVVRALSGPEDVVLSNHRNHGHFLTYTGNFLGLIAEVMGREAGVCGGVGGSQHIAFGHFHSNGVQGGMTAIGVGHGLALQRRNQEGIAGIFIGDGTLGQGLVYESMNLASVWGVPALFVVENNGIAQTTPTAATLGGSLEERGRAFGLDTWHLDDSDADFVERAERVVTEVRARRKPGFLVIDAKRLGPHSKGDDLRDPGEMAAIRLRDPLARLGRSLDDSLRGRIDAAAEEFLAEVYREAAASPEATRGEGTHRVFPAGAPLVRQSFPLSAAKNVRASLSQGLADLLDRHPEVLVLGEDLHEPYGGAFKVTAGLSTRFPGRVVSTPISEAGIIGAAIGLALAGFRPVVEVMFADFLTLGMDQIYNHAVKFPGMFADAKVPLVIRAASGGRRGYGPTHSQSPEKLMGAVPGLTVLCPSHHHDPGALLQRAVLDWNSPTVFLEHKLLYAREVDPGGYRELKSDPDDPGAAWFPTLIRGVSTPDVTFVAFGHSVLLAEAAAEQLAEEEVETEIVVPSLVAPLPRRTFANHLSQRRRIVVIEEASGECGFSAELAAVLLQAGYRGSYRRVAPPPAPIPAARSLEGAVLPSEQDVLNAAIASIVADIVSAS